MLRLKLSAVQEKFLELLIKKHREFIFECGYSTDDFHRVIDIHEKGGYFPFDRNLLNSLKENAKLAGIIL